MSYRNVSGLRERVEGLAEVRDRIVQLADFLESMSEECDAIGWSQVSASVRRAVWRSHGLEAALNGALRRMKRGDL